MKTNKNLFLLLSVLSMTFVFSGTTLKAETGSEGLDDEPILVGRVSHVEGALLRYQPGDEGWTPTVDDTPFGAGESLYTEGNARAEIILPNGTWARFDGGTQVQLIELREDLTDLELSSGTGRFYSNGAYPLIQVKTIFGDVTAQGDTVFDLHVYGNAVEVIALKGIVSFWRRNTAQRFEVKAGLGSIVADAHAVSVGTGDEPPGWAAWNRERDALWAARMTSGEVSAAYLPPSLRHEAHALDANGVWEKAYYDSGFAWYPGRVAWLSSGTNVGWVPRAPHEPYYAHRRWGHKAVVARDVNLTNLNVNVTRYRNHRHAVVIDRKDLHRVRNYRELKITSFDRASVGRNCHVVTTPGRIPTRPIAIKSSPPRQAKAIDAVPKRAEASVTPVKKQEARESIAPSQPAAKIADPGRAATKVSRAPGWPMVERALTKPADEARMGSRYRSTPTKLKTDEGQAKSKPTFSGAKKGASDNDKRTEPRQQTRERRVKTPFHASKGGNDRKASLETGRIQPSSRGSMDRIGRGSFRN